MYICMYVYIHRKIQASMCTGTYVCAWKCVKVGVCM